MKSFLKQLDNLIWCVRANPSQYAFCKPHNWIQNWLHNIKEVHKLTIVVENAPDSLNFLRWYHSYTYLSATDRQQPIASISHRRQRTHRTHSGIITSDASTHPAAAANTKKRNETESNFAFLHLLNNFKLGFHIFCRFICESGGCIIYDDGSLISAFSHVWNYSLHSIVLTMFRVF